MSRLARHFVRHLALILSMVAMLSTAAASPTITVAAEDDWPPYSSVQPGRGKAEGFAVDIVREAFGSQGVEVRFVAMPFARCLFAAQQGAVSACFNATIVDDNRDLFHWHDTPMFHEELAIIGKSSSPRADLQQSDLRGKTVGYTLGYTYPTSFHRDDRIRKLSAKSDRVLLEMVLAGRIDYALMNGMPAQLRINTDAAMRGRLKRVGAISDDGFWLAFSKADPAGREWRDTFERGLQAIRLNGRYAEMDQAFRARLGLPPLRAASEQASAVPSR